MNKDFYSFANRMNAAGGDASTEELLQKERLDDVTKISYQQSVLAAVRKDRRAAKRKYLTAAAACIAILAAATVFHDEVQAAIGRISYSLSAAMGLQSDLALYKESIHTSVRDGGYIVTLQEAAAAPEKLAVSYTIQREDGRPMRDYADIEDHLSINGQEFPGSRRCTFAFLDKGQYTIGGQISYDITGIDLSGENTYGLELTNGSGDWSFRFKADGSDMYADTKHMPLGINYILPDGTSLVLDELSINDLEQRIAFHASDEDIGHQYAITLHATDDQGKTAVFFICQSEDGKGYMMNEENSENGHISGDAKTVTVTLHVVEFSKTGPETEQGQIFKGGQEIIVPPAKTASANQDAQSGSETANGYIQTGNAVTWDLTALQ